MAKQSKTTSPFVGRWRITSMETWSQDVVDAEVEGYFEFRSDGFGRFQFAYVTGDIDYRDRTRDEKPFIEWSWKGKDELDPASGRGWAVIDGDKIQGFIAIHRGDESEFEAIRIKEKGVGQQKGMKAVLSRTAKRKQNYVYQFKITLLEVQPPIWRRIQVKDCTLDKLHEHIQTSMGWTNSHLHRFQIGEERYADPMLMEEGMEEFFYNDSTTTLLSGILPQTDKQCRFVYEYDFGDGWEHEIQFEGCPRAEPGRKYPLCLEGERACPPEDVGGTGGYEEFLQIITNPHNKAHKETLRWAGGKFDPEAFDSAAATKAMKKGLPDWRREVR